jgi:hypothetical protein
MAVSININQPFIQDVKQRDLITPLPISPATGYYSVSNTNFGELKETYDEKPGIGVQVKILYSISAKIFISTGLDLSFLRYKRSIEVADLYDTQNIIGHSWLTNVRAANGDLIFNQNGGFTYDPPMIFGPSDKIGKTSAFFAGAPVLVGTTFLNEKLTILGGGIFSLPITASTYEQELIFEYDGKFSLGGVGSGAPFVFSGSKVHQQDTRKNVTYHFKPSAGLMMQISYRLLKKLQADLTMQKNFTPIYKSEYQSAGKAKLNLLSLGISYTVMNFNSPE